MIVILAIILVSMVSLNSARQKAPVSSYSTGGFYEIGGGAPVAASVSDSSSLSFSNPLPANSAMKESSAIAPAPAQELPSVDKKIIKSGSLNLQVEKVDNATDKISQIASNNGGDVFSSNIRQSKSNMKSGTVTVKVPVANFNKAFDDLKKIATLVINESTSGQDVTEQYVDLQAQLKNKQAEEESFVKILERQGTIDDVLKATREVARVRGEIERLQGRIKLLESQTDMSTISISLTEDANITVVDSWRPWQVVKESFNSLIKKLQGLIDFLIQFILVVLPMLLIWALIIWIIYKIIRKIYLKIKNKSTQITK